MQYDSKRNESSALYEQVPVNDTFIYVPILKELIFKNAEVSQHMNKPAMCEALCDGRCYRHQPLVSKSNGALQI